MSAKLNITSLARIEVQQNFCDDCSICIEKKLQEIEDLNNVRLYPEESLITFNFVKVNNLSTVLNTLFKMGYPEKGDRIDEAYFSKPTCSCQKRLFKEVC